MENQTVNLRTFLWPAFFVALLVMCLVIKHRLLNNYVSLNTAPALAAEVAPSVGSSSIKGLPIPNKDFKIVQSKYFDNNKWAVAAIKVPKTDTATVVLEDINGVYTVVLGPGTAFSSDVVQEMPSSVAAYLISQGLIQENVQTLRQAN